METHIVCITTQDNIRYWSQQMRLTGMPYRIHAVGCASIAKYGEEVFHTNTSVHEIECMMWADQISEKTMDRETVRGTITVCPCAIKAEKLAGV